jgi:RTX calcium-binding nonapeptide repeat (4 copies)/FG-GAP-like repeat
MTSMTLSSSTQNAINVALTVGPGPNNQNYLAAYTAISSDIKSNGGFDSGTLNWFAQAGLVNTQAFTPSAAGTYIWNYTIAAAQAQGTNLSVSDIQVASNTIADTVFRQLQRSGFVFTDNSSSPENFAPTSIVRIDAGSGLEKLSDLHPGSNLTAAIWGGTLFARTQLNDPTYFADNHIDLTPGSRDCAAITWGSVGAVNSVLTNLGSIAWNEGPVNAYTNAVVAIASQDNAAIKACFPQQGGTLQNGSSMLKLDGSGNLTFDQVDGAGRSLQTLTIQNNNALTFTASDVSDTQPWSQQTAVTNLYGIRDLFLQVNDDGNVGALQDRGQSINPADIAGLFGSQIGRIIGGNSLAGRVAAGTLTEAVARQIGQHLESGELLNAITETMPGTTIVSDEAVSDAVAEMDPSFGGDIATVGIGQLASALFAELAHELHLTGFAGGLVTTLGMTITSQLVKNIVGEALHLTNPATGLAYTTWDGFAGGQIITNIEGTVGGFLGSWLAGQIAVPETPAEATGASIGSAIGAFAGTFFGPLGSLVGSFFGDLAGEAVGSFFGDPYSGGETWLVPNWWMTDGNFYAAHGATITKFVDLANTQVNAVNHLAIYTGASIDYATSHPHLYYRQDGSTFYQFEPQGDGFMGVVGPMIYNLHDASQLAPLADPGIMHLVHEIHLTGGDPLMAVAWEHSDAGNASAFAADLEIAHDYRTYVDNARVINALMAAEPESAFAAGWTITLLRAQAIGLNAPVQGTAGNDTMQGYAGHHDIIDGGAGDDTIHGNGGNDTLWGGEGNDTFDGARGSADRIDGGPGVDTVYYFTLPSGIIADLSAGTVQDGVVVDVLTNVEQLNGTNYDDIFVSSAAANYFWGNGGSDTVSYAASARGVAIDLAAQTANDGVVTDGFLSIENATGSAYADTISGTAGANVIDGGAGDDTIHGSGGNDTLWGGAGNDTFDGARGSADCIDGGPGVDTVYYFTLPSGIIADLSTGTVQDGVVTDVLTNVENINGTNYDDIFVSGAAANYFWGNGGSDTVSYAAASRGVAVDLGSVSAQTGAPDPQAWDGAVFDRFLSIENATGSAYADQLWGDAGSNVLGGGAGNDVLGGRGGNDIIDGGPGVDTAVFSGISAAYVVFAGTDGHYTVGGPDGLDTLSDVERLQFDDRAVNLPTSSISFHDYGAYSLNWQIQATGDINGDGTDDIMWRDTSTGEVLSWIMANGNWVSRPSYGVYSMNWQIQAMGDINGDGTDDIMWRDTSTGQVLSWIMANGNWVSRPSYGVYSMNWQIQAMGDLNGDGIDDILWRDTSTGEVLSWIMANGNWVSRPSYGVYSMNWQIQGTGDINGDGTDDIMWRDNSTGEVLSWIMANGNWVSRPSYGVYGMNWQIQAMGDLNGDGTDDILWRDNSDGDVVSWMMANGNWAAHPIYGLRPMSLDAQAIADINHNGAHDIMWRDLTTGEVTAWII